MAEKNRLIRLSDSNSTYVCPVTKSDGVFMSDGNTTLETKMNEVTSQLEQIMYFVTPQMFGAKGDGITDDYIALQNMFDYIHAKGGGVVIIPKGKHPTSKTLAVPQNTYVLGCGVSSYIFLTKSTHLGVALMNGGSNVTIDNINVGFLGDDGATVVGSDLGGIGFSTICYESIKKDSSESEQNVENLVAKNIYSDGRFPIQTEPSSKYSIKNVVYDNIVAPKGQVSISPNGGINDGIGRNVINANVSNIHCSLFRIGYGGKGGQNINLNNINACYVRLLDDNINLNNCNIIGDANNPHYISNDYPEALKTQGENIVINNIDVDCKKLNNYLYSYRYLEYPVKISNATIKNGITYNVYTDNVMDSMFINCDFTDEQNTKSNIFGTGYNVKANIPAIADFFNDSIDINHSIILGNGITEGSALTNTIITRTGRRCVLKGVLSVSTGVDTDVELFTIASDVARPKAEFYFWGIAIDRTTNNSIPLPIIIGVDGKALLKPFYGLNYDNISAIMLDTQYII